MKRFALLLALAALPASAGVTYDFESASTGLRSGTIKGTVFVEGRAVRMDMKTGDNLLFKDGTVVLSGDGGKTLSVYDPASKTYYVINLSDLTGAAGGLMNAMGGMFKLSFNNPKVAVRDLGNGETLGGYPTRRSQLDSSYDITVDAMGQKMTTHMVMTTESWSTDKLGAEFSNFLQARNVRTGYADLDKLIDAQGAAIAGRFPLKQITTVKVRQGNGGELTSTTTSTVSNIARKSLLPAVFAAPSGFTKVENPVTRMMKSVH